MLRTHRFILFLSILAIGFFGPGQAFAADFYASPTGTTSTAAGTGTLTTPWSLQTALSQPSVVHAGDTIWLRGGRYTGSFISYVTGASGNPITVRSFVGERATIDGSGFTDATLQVQGAWATYWGFEVTNSDPNRPNVQWSRPTAIDVFGPNTQFVNLVVHDGGQGFGFWEPAVDSGIYGSLVYYNGNSTFDHGIYTQNNTGTKKIEDNLIFNNRGYGLHMYGSELAHLNNFYLSGNASFRNGLLGGGIPNRNMLLGGGPLVNNATLVNNFFYSKKDGTQPGTGWMLGYNYGLGSQNAIVQNNYIADDMWFVNPVALTLNGNTFYTSPGYCVGVSPASYPSNTYATTLPSGPVVFVRPNRYEAGRAHIVVYNWGQQATVNADVSSVLTPGTSYEIRNAQDFFGAPVKTGTYDGTAISIPMTGLSAAAPVGFAVPQSSGPEFNAFVLLKVAGGSCTYALGTSSSSATSGVGSGSISVTSGAGCAWTATSNAAWLTVVSGATGTGNGTVSYGVAANATCVARTGTFLVAGQTFTVNQAAGSLAASLSPTSASTGAASGGGSTAVTAGASCAWTATSNAAWITVVSGASGAGNGTVSYSVAANATCAARTGTLTIAGQTFTVSQSAGTLAASLSPTAASTGAASGGGSTAVTAGAGCAWTATSNAAWLTVVSGASGTGNGTVTYSVVANGTCSARTGTLTIAGQTFTVSQSAGAAAASLSPTAASTGAASGGGSTAVTAGASCAWTATSNAAWLTVVSGASGTGNGTVSYSVAANATCAARTGTLTIAGLTFTANQSAGTLAASLSPTTASTGAASGGGSTAVTAGASCAWTATSNAAWLTVVSGASGTGNGTVSYGVAANATCAARTGTLTIAGQTFTVSQSAGAAAASLSPASASTGAASGGGSIGVTAGASCAWTATSNAAWITISSGASGSGSGTVNYTVASNSVCARTGTLTVAGQTFTVSQAAGGNCSAGFYPVTPCRAMSTLNAASSLGGPALSAHQARVFPLTASACGIPASAKSVAINVTVVKPEASGALHVYPGDQSWTSATTVSFPAHRTRANGANIQLATDGSGSIGVYNESFGATNVIIDVSGYYR